MGARFMQVAMTVVFFGQWFKLFWKPIMQAITTKYMPANSKLPERIKAECDAGSITIPVNHTLDEEHRHRLSVRELMYKLKWNFAFVTGQTKSGTYVHVLTTIEE
jgi:hypothetical protein